MNEKATIRFVLTGVKYSQSDLGKHYKTFCGLYIRNNETETTFSYGKEKPVINGKVYERKEKQSSVLYDSFNGVWEVREMQDCPAQITGKIK